MGNSAARQTVDGSAYAAIAELLDHEDGIVLTNSEGETAELPADTAALLRTAIAENLRGRTPQIISSDQMLSTREAAEILGISRPTLVRILEEGEIEYVQPGGVHRRISALALAEYQERVAGRRKKVLAEMTEEAAEDDAYDQVNGFVQTR